VLISCLTLALEISTRGCGAFQSQRLLFTLRRRRSVLISCLTLTLEKSMRGCGAFRSDRLIFTLRMRRSVLISCLTLALEKSMRGCSAFRSDRLIFTWRRRWTQRWASTLANRSNARHRSNIGAPPPPTPPPPKYMYPKCANLCDHRGRKRFIASWGLRMSHICPCTPCPSPQGYRSKVESHHFAHHYVGGACLSPV
jgi:hypothetical protein